MQSWPAPTVPTLPGPGVPLRLHDTATGEVRPVAAGRTAGMYVCGITPYDSTHLGHAATYLTFDLVGRALRDCGSSVTYVQNVTDVDDPLLARAVRDGDDWRALADRETARFRQDMAALRVLPPDRYQGVVEAMPLIVELVGRLERAGGAYRLAAGPAEGARGPDIYFDVSAARRFGGVAGLPQAVMLALAAERGGDPGRAGKRHPLDPLLWRAARPEEPCWDSPFGPGRPGWHVECVAIALDGLGMGFDVQGGGADLAFPHHEMSAAHAEAATGSWPFARHYVHTGMIGLHGEKMSKSLGNLVFVSDLLRSGVDPSAVRLALFEAHYRTDRMWDAAVLHRAERRLGLWRAAATNERGAGAAAVVRGLRTALADDLDTPRAIAVLDRWATDTVQGPLADDDEAPAAVARAVDALLGVTLR